MEKSTWPRRTKSPSSTCTFVMKPEFSLEITKIRKFADPELNEEFFKNMKQQFSENIEKKKALVEQAQALQDSTGLAPYMGSPHRQRRPSSA